jgi:hypothetical protein
MLTGLLGFGALTRICKYSKWIIWFMLYDETPCLVRTYAETLYAK